MTALCSVRHSAAGTPHLAAAAATSIILAAAPASRSGRQKFRTLALPVVRCRPHPGCS
jgi:hypothetical protein